ncbi:hypothetical protein SESBI_36928 [Sesbania bispinosa]|nr:hypothetical protein SESBI_36928 [Sesbania bispinosa]
MAQIGLGLKEGRTTATGPSATKYNPRVLGRRRPFLEQFGAHRGATVKLFPSTTSKSEKMTRNTRSNGAAAANDGAGEADNQLLQQLMNEMRKLRRQNQDLQTTVTNMNQASMRRSRS